MRNKTKGYIVKLLRYIQVLSINMAKMIIASLSLLASLFLIIDWYDHSSHVFNLSLAGFILYKIVVRFITGVDYGDERDIS